MPSGVLVKLDHIEFTVTLAIDGTIMSAFFFKSRSIRWDRSILSFRWKRTRSVSHWSRSI